MPGAKLSSDQRLSLILETQRTIAAAGDDLQRVMELVAERSQAIIGADAQTLIQRADVAMYDCKRDSGAFTFYDESTHEYDVTRLTLVAELRRALARRELLLHYQPKAALDNGEVRSVEALLRWMHPSRLSSPARAAPTGEWS